MFSSLQSLILRHAGRLKSRSHAALTVVQREWPSVLKEAGVAGLGARPSALRSGVLYLACPSHEEAGELRLVAERLVSELNKRIEGGYAIKKIRFSVKPDERTQ